MGTKGGATIGNTMRDILLDQLQGYGLSPIMKSHLWRQGFEMPTTIVQKLQEEIQALEHELNHELPRELKRARALGDLSENAEFIMAKQRQDYVGARLSQLKKRLAELSLINFSNIPKDKIAFGSKVVLYDVDRNSEIEYKLVTSEEANVSKGLISTTSPIGRGLMGKKEGDSVRIATPNGVREFEIRAVQTIHEQSEV